MARQGKIARLPEPIREELNKRLRNGALGPQILPWLNSHPDVVQVMAEFFAGATINAQNLSDWRNGGYEDWLEKQDRTYRIKELASYAAKLSGANQTSIAEGAAAIASGRLLELLEAATDSEQKLTAEEIQDIVGSLTSLRSAEIAQQRTDQDAVKLRQKGEELKLAREKFQRDTAEMVLKSARDTAIQQIANAPIDRTAQLDAVGKQLFGDLWK